MKTEKTLDGEFVVREEMMDAEPSDTTNNSADLSIYRIVQVVWRSWRTLAAVFGVCSLLGTLTAWLWPLSYEANASVFPVSATSPSLSQLSSLASLAGLTLPDAGSTNDPSRTVSALMGSRLLAETLVADAGLESFLTSDGKVLGNQIASGEKGVRTVVALVQNAMSFKTDKTSGVITLTFTWDDPDKAQNFCNRLVTILDNLLVAKSLTVNRKRTQALERQIEEQKDKVDQLQNAMAKFQRDTSLLNPQAQSSRAIESYTALVQQKMSLELQLATAQASYSADNPKLQLLKTQLVNLEEQIVRFRNQVDGDLPSIKSAPEDLIRYQNLARDLEIATKLYGGLLANQEQSRLSDDKDQVYIEVLDSALLPTSGTPNRLLVFFVVVFLGASSGIATVIIRDLFRSRTKIS